MNLKWRASSTAHWNLKKNTKNPIKPTGLCFLKNPGFLNPDHTACIKQFVYDSVHASIMTAEVGSHPKNTTSNCKLLLYEICMVQSYAHPTSAILIIFICNLEHKKKWHMNWHVFIRGQHIPWGAGYPQLNWIKCHSGAQLEANISTDFRSK